MLPTLGCTGRGWGDGLEPEDKMQKEPSAKQRGGGGEGGEEGQEGEEAEQGEGGERPLIYLL